VRNTWNVKTFLLLGMEEKMGTTEISKESYKIFYDGVST